MDKNFPLRITLNIILVLFFLKLFFFFSSRSQFNGFYLVSFIQDTFLFLTVYFIFSVAIKYPRMKKISELIFYSFFLFAGVVSFIYTFFLLDLINFPLNMFAFSEDIIMFFGEYFLSLKLIISLVIGITSLFFWSLYYPSKIPDAKQLKIIYLVVTLLFIPTSFEQVINPMIFSVSQEVISYASADSNIKKVVSSVPEKGKANQFNFLDKRFKSVPQINTDYDRVIVLVMESINYRNFTQYISKDRNNFFNRNRKNIFLFENYYTLNLDSFTSLISIVENIFVPFRAYVREDHFMFVKNFNNLTRVLNQNGFETLFITSYGSQLKKFVPVIKDWKSVIFSSLKEDDLKYACVTNIKIENACEDLSVIDELISSLRKNRLKNKKSFVFQEMVYGHSSEWKNIKGIEPIEYYNHYFNMLMLKLKKYSLLENTLIVILSDHGPRDNSFKPENYNIPLVIYNNKMNSGSNHQFFSHLNFSEIILNFMEKKNAFTESKRIFTLGNSNELIYGEITSDKKYTFINDRTQNYKTNTDKASIFTLNREFQEYLNYFEYLRDEK